MKPSSTSDKRSKKGRPKPSKSGVTKGKGAAQKAVSGGKRAMSVAATTDGDNLLDRARMQWQFGDWENLVALERETLEGRSEEHTSELQSLMRISYAVFGLKKQKSYKNTTN